MAQYTENTSGVIAAINACIAAAGGTVTSYTHNTGGVIAALLALKTAIASGGGGGGTTATVEIAADAGESLTLGEAVYLNTDGKVYKAGNAGTRAEATIFGFVKTNASINTSATLIVRGSVTGLSGLSVGVEYFLGASGAITTTPPTSSGEYVVNAGQAQSASVLDVDAEQPVLLS